MQDEFDVQLNQNEPLSLFDDAVDATSSQMNMDNRAYRSYAANENGGSGFFASYGPEANPMMIIQSKSTANHQSHQKGLTANRRAAMQRGGADPGSSLMMQQHPPP